MLRVAGDAIFERVPRPVFDSSEGHDVSHRNTSLLSVSTLHGLEMAALA